MLGRVKMFGSMFVLRRIAAAYLSTDKTQPQMHPRVAHLNALLANMFGGLAKLDLVEVRAMFRHQFLPGMFFLRLIK
jgi:hypothetical protein